MEHKKQCITLDHFQITYRPNWSTENTKFSTFHPFQEQLSIITIHLSQEEQLYN